MGDNNILIGIGGTGARIVESVLPLLLSGLGPSDVFVGFVDQDEANGNIRRTREFVRNYETFRKMWTGNQSPCRLDWTSPNGGTPFARHSVLPISRDNDLWCPHPDKAANLLSILQESLLPEEEKQMLSLLFEPGPAEQAMPLGVGYRARPHIGATAMVSKVVAGDPFWDGLRERIRTAASGEKVRIFLAGSVFGGTGAAGFPTIARVIRRLIKESENTSAPLAGRVSVGGVLALPYFSFPPPKDATENVARSEQLLTQSRAALKYYHELFKQETVFNELYILGWDPRFVLKQHARGGDAQANPSLLPELVAATSALRFFASDRATPPSESVNRLFISGRASANRMTWTDLPPPSDAKAIDVYEKLGTLLRFCSVWRNMIRPALKPRFFGGQAWFNLQGVNKVKFSDQKNEECLVALDALVNTVLIWAGSLASYAARGGISKFDLWDTNGLISFSEDDEKEPIKLQALSDARALEVYNRIVTPLDAMTPPPDQASLFREISGMAMAGNHEGLGRILAATYHGARINSEI